MGLAGKCRAGSSEEGPPRMLWVGRAQPAPLRAVPRPQELPQNSCHWPSISRDRAPHTNHGIQPSPQFLPDG